MQSVCFWLILVFIENYIQFKKVHLKRKSKQDQIDTRETPIDAQRNPHNLNKTPKVILSPQSKIPYLKLFEKLLIQLSGFEFS